MAKRAFNLPNLLTYGRILAVPLVVLCFFLEGELQSSEFARWSAFAIFILASVTDYLDGYLARAWKQTSNIGRMLDPIADKLLVATCLLLLAADTDHRGGIAGWSLWAAIIILCREILVSGMRVFVAASLEPAQQILDRHDLSRQRDFFLRLADAFAHPREIDEFRHLIRP